MVNAMMGYSLGAALAGIVLLIMVIVSPRQRLLRLCGVGISAVAFVWLGIWGITMLNDDARAAGFLSYADQRAAVTAGYRDASAWDGVRQQHMQDPS